MNKPAIGCGETSETVAACFHGAVAALYCVMLYFHVRSVLSHWERR